MGECFITRRGGAGSANLNFSVVGGTSTPASPTANMIWVNTDAAITDWIFSATQPDGVEGRVWFKVRTSSNAAFNAVKKNGLWVYPTGCKQYVSGAWVYKGAKTYQSGAWVDWWNDYLYESGDEHSDVTGGWTAQALPYSSSYPSYSAVPTVTRTATSITAAIPYTKNGILCTANAINLTDFAILHWEGTSKGTEQNSNVRILLRESLSGYRDTNNAASLELESGISTGSSSGTVPLDRLSGDYYVCIDVYSGGSCTTNNMWLT